MGQGPNCSLCYSYCYNLSFFEGELCPPATWSLPVHKVQYSNLQCRRCNRSLHTLCNSTYSFHQIGPLEILVCNQECNPGQTHLTFPILRLLFEDFLQESNIQGRFVTFGSHAPLAWVPLQ